MSRVVVRSRALSTSVVVYCGTDSSRTKEVCFSSNPESKIFEKFKPISDPHCTEHTFSISWLRTNRDALDFCADVAVESV